MVIYLVYGIAWISDIGLISAKIKGIFEYVGPLYMSDFTSHTNALILLLLAIILCLSNITFTAFNTTKEVIKVCVIHSVLISD